MSKSQMNGFKKQLDERRLEREKVEISLLSKVVSSRDLLGLHGRSASHRFYDGFIPSLMTVMVNAHHVQKIHEYQCDISKYKYTDTKV